MAVLLRQIYEGIRDTEEIELIAGADGLDRVVRWVHMVESLEISTFLEGDEIVLTTGIALKSQAELLDLVKLNYQQNAAGMIINVGPYMKEIDKAVIAFGDANSFPIFQVPWRVHMANIMRYSTMLINKDEQKKMELKTALKNAIYFQGNEEYYMPALLNLGYKKDWLYGIMLIEFQQKQGIPLDPGTRAKIVKLWVTWFHRFKNQVQIIEEDEQITIFYSNITDEKMKQYTEEVWHQIEAYLLPKGKIYIGMGRTTNHIQGIGKSYHQAEQVLELQKRRSSANQIIPYKDLGLYKLLIGMEDTELLEEFYNECLGKLEKYDRVNETDFLYFLKKYFALGCSVQDVAAALHLHRNSVTYKLHKIEEITGFSMSDQESRTRFIVAFMIQELR